MPEGQSAKADFVLLLPRDLKTRGRAGPSGHSQERPAYRRARAISNAEKPALPSLTVSVARSWPWRTR